MQALPAFPAVAAYKPPPISRSVSSSACPLFADGASRPADQLAVIAPQRPRKPRRHQSRQQTVDCGDRLQDRGRQRWFTWVDDKRLIFRAVDRIGNGVPRRGAMMPLTPTAANSRNLARGRARHPWCAPVTAAANWIISTHLRDISRRTCTASRTRTGRQTADV